jgi:Zn-dependent protease with chaperone function
VLAANYFDGSTTRIRVVHISAAGANLLICGDGVDRCIPFADVRVDERLGRAARRLRLGDGSFCEVRDLDTLDQLLASMGHVDGRIDRLQRRHQAVLAAAVACLAIAFAAYEWILPWAAAVGARHMPPGIARKLSDQAMTVLDGGILKPSGIGEERRRELSARFHALRLPQGGTAGSELLFRASPQLGANAFTLPDGRIILLDELVSSLGDDQQILAVLAHELGHAHGAHGMQQLLQGSAVGALLSLYLGDISQLLAAAPAAVLNARYSQELEREADDYGAALLLRNGLSPALLADALASLAKSHPASAKAGYLSSHPATAERIRHLHVLAARGGP